MVGKVVRLARIFNPLSSNTVISPLDHGVTQGPIQGLGDIKRSMAEVSEGGADAVVVHRGNVPLGSWDRGKGTGLIVHVSAGTNLSPYPDRKVSVCGVEDALRLGADAVSFHLNLGNPHEGEMIRELGRVSGESLQWGVPLMVMAYVRGPDMDNGRRPDLVKHAARVAAELGADLVKVDYTGDPQSFLQVTEGCPVPVVIAGGSKEGERELFETVKGALKGGARGVSIGRNVFQHKSPGKMVAAISALVHKNATVEEALEMLK
ncbi:MAG: class I fructose-bisphosphate aldolase family protein [Deltaproteobacteria bacterium]|nr:class I fructose-bisphosphate aldolase family protein [Deltaproteobacteria bacterium]